MIPVSKTHIANLDSVFDRFGETVTRTGQYSNGQLVGELEALIRNKLGGSRHIIATSSWTTGAILMARILHEKRPITKVLISAFTFHATLLPWLWLTPQPEIIPVDTDEFGSISLDSLSMRLDRYTSPDDNIVICPTDVFGNPANYDGIMNIRVGRRNTRHITVFADSAQALGSRAGKNYANMEDHWIGRQAQIHVFSLSPTKPITGLEGGLVSIEGGYKHDADALRQLRDYGQTKSNTGQYLRSVGLNARMPEFNAAVAVHNVNYESSSIPQRQEIAAYYDELLDSMALEDVRAIPVSYASNRAYYAIILNPLRFCRKRVIAEMQGRGVETRPYFSPALTNQPVLRGRINPKIDCTEAELLAESVLCLPMHTTLTKKEITKVVDTLKRATA